MLLNNAGQVFGFKPHGGGVVIGVDANQAGRFEEIFIKKNLHFSFCIVQNAKWRHRPGRQAQNTQQLTFRGKAQRARLVCFPKRLQVCPFVSLYRNEVTILLFLIPHERCV